MRAIRLWLLVIMLVGLPVALSACGEEAEAPGAETPAGETPDGEIPPIPSAPEAPGVTDDKIVLGYTTQLTGPYASILQVVFTGLREAPAAYFQYINEEQGGVCGGREIEWIVEDDQGTVEGALAATRRLAEDEEVFAFFFSFGEVTHHPRVVEYLNENRIPDMYLVTGSPYASENPLDYRFMFRGLTDYYTEGRIIAEFIQESFPGKNVAIAYDPAFELSVEVARGTREGLEGSGNPVVADEEWPVTNLDFTPLALRFQEAGTEIVVSVFAAPVATLTVDAMERIGAPLEDYILICPSATSEPALFELLGDKVEKLGGVYGPQYGQPGPLWGDEPSIAGYRRIIQEYAAADLDHRNPYGWFAFVTAALMVETLERACEDGPLTREGLVAAAESIDDPFRYLPEELEPFMEATLVAPIEMSPTDHSPFNDWIIVQAQGDEWVLLGDKVYHQEDVLR